MILLISIPIAFLVISLIVSYVRARKADQARANDYVESLRKIEALREEAKRNNRPIITATQSTSSRAGIHGTSSFKSSDFAEAQKQMDNSDFLVSMAVASATDSVVMGMATGGSLAGSIIGESMNDDSNRNHSSFDHDYSPSYESSTSSDFGSSDYSSSDFGSSDSTSSSFD